MELIGSPVAEILSEYASNHKIKVVGSTVLAELDYTYPDRPCVSDLDLMVDNQLELAGLIAEIPDAHLNIKHSPYRLTFSIGGKTLDIIQSKDLGSIHRPGYGCSTADCATALLTSNLKLEVEEGRDFVLRFVNSKMLTSHPNTNRSVRIAVRALWATTLKNIEGNTVRYDFSPIEKSWIKKTAYNLIRHPELDPDSFEKLHILMERYKKELPIEFRYLI